MYCMLPGISVTVLFPERDMDHTIVDCTVHQTGGQAASKQQQVGVLWLDFVLEKSGQTGHLAFFTTHRLK